MQEEARRLNEQRFGKPFSAVPSGDDGVLLFAQVDGASALNPLPR
jgi:hypothetical protein